MARGNHNPRTLAQQEALALGARIRRIAGVHSHHSQFDPDLAVKIAEACDEQMHRLGYESITERENRIMEELRSPDRLFDRSMFKFQKKEQR
jgi:hypothetical protein